MVSIAIGLRGGAESPSVGYLVLPAGSGLDEPTSSLVDSCNWVVAGANQPASELESAGYTLDEEEPHADGAVSYLFNKSFSAGQIIAQDGKFTFQGGSGSSLKVTSSTAEDHRGKVRRYDCYLYYPVTGDAGLDRLTISDLGIGLGLMNDPQFAEEQEMDAIWVGACEDDCVLLAYQEREDYVPPTHEVRITIITDKTN